MTPPARRWLGALPLAALLVTGQLAAGGGAAAQAGEPPQGAREPVGEPRGGPSGPTGEEQRAERRLVVRVADPARVGRAVAAAESAGAAPREAATATSFVVDVPAGDFATVRRALLARADVVSAREAFRRELHVTPSDTAWSTQSPYLTTVAAPAAWDVTRGDDDVRIAVIDTGVDVAHPDLAGKVVGRYNAVDGSTDVADALGHGTMVASVAAAATNNGAGIAGTGYGSSILAVKVADAAGQIDSNAVAVGIRWAADHGADVINLSLGAPTFDPAESEAVAHAQSRGALVVASAGNDGTTTQMYPAALPGVLAVGATDHAGSARTSFSTYGPWVDVAAPGERITVAASGFGYTTADGTSFSAPLVAGGAALLAARRPDATGAEISAALTSTASSTSTLGFARGVVDLRGALDVSTPDTVPDLTAPAEGDPVGGDVAVTATSGADRVRFALGGRSQIVAVSPDGVARTTLEGFGLAGAQTVTAADCTAVGCSAGTDQAAVTVAGDAPALTAPADGATVGPTVTLAADTPGGSVRFTVDDRTVATDPTAPYEATVDASAFTDGAHVVRAVQCDRAGAVCDTANPSAARTVTVRALRPRITSIDPAPFSPDGDGNRDTTTVTWTLEDEQAVELRIRDAAGTTLVTRQFGTLPAGAHTSAWDGLGAPDGTYTAELSTSRVVDGTTVQGLDTATVLVDTRRPALSSAAASPSTVFPYPDSYRDSTALRVTVGEPLGSLTVRIYDSAGVAVRTIAGGSRPAAGPTSIGWDGRTSAGRIAPAGAYTFAFTAVDRAGNPTTSARASVSVSARRLVSAGGSATVTPFASTSDRDLYIGTCSAVYAPAREAWPGSQGYYSNAACAGAAGDDLAAGVARYTLPAAIRYGSVRVTAYGGSVPGGTDTAQLVYLDRHGRLSGSARTLGATAGSYPGPAVSGSSYLRGRTLGWMVRTTGGRWYDVKSFTVSFTYYVLR